MVATPRNRLLARRQCTTIACPDHDAPVNDMGQQHDGDLGLAHHRRKGGAVSISNHSQPATVLGPATAAIFLEDMESLPFADRQQEMARLTGNYRRGNERLAKQHRRNA